MSGLTEAQRDGRACLRCGREDGPMGPVGELHGVQVVAHHVCPSPRPVPPEYEELAAQLEQEAHTLRELGRYGQRALGEGEDLVDALWDTSDRLSRIAERVDRVANRIDAEESARLLEREGIGP